MEKYPLYDVEEVSTFSEFIEKISDKFGDNIAFKSEENEWSYFDFCYSVKHVAHNLSKYKRKQIFIDITDSYVFAVTYFATVISGNIAVLAERKDLEFLMLDEDYINLSSVEIDKILNEEACGCTDKKNNKYTDEYGRIEDDIDENAVCTIVCSSGTTSWKKGVMLSQKNLLADMRGGMQLYEYPKEAVYVNIIPYTHLFGIVADMLGPLYSGGTICTIKNKMMFFEALKKYKPTHMNLPPIIVEMIWKMLKTTNDFAMTTGGRLKKIMCAGAKLNEEIAEEFEKYNLHVYSAYGLTEASPCVSMNRDKANKKGSVGMILPCCKVEIIENEVVVSGETIMQGYYNDEAATDCVKKEGKLYTGDLGYIDNDGFLFLTGRKSNLIVFEDGTKLVPEVLEANICKLEEVKACLVEKIQNTNRIMVDIIIVSDEKIKNDKLDSIISGQLERGKIHNITIQKEELARNSLGKIIRHR